MGGEEFALAHNGSLLRVAGQHLASGGYQDQVGQADTAHLFTALAAAPGSVHDALQAVSPQVEGSIALR